MNVPSAPSGSSPHAAVLLVGTRSDAGRFRIAAATLERHAAGVDRYVLPIDAQPGDALDVDAAPLWPWEFVAYDRLTDLAYSSTESELLDALVPHALDALLARAYDAVVALPPGAVVRAPLDPFFAVLEAGDVVPDPAFDVGWWGARRGSGRRRERRHPVAEMVSLRTASTESLAGAATVVVSDVTPPAGGRDAARALRDAGDVRTAFEAAFRRDWLDADAGAAAPPYRYAAFSNGVRVDGACRALLREAVAAGERFDEPGDVRAPASFFAWLCAPSKPGRQLSRYLERYVALRPALRRAFPRADADPAPLLRHLRAQRPADLDAVWYSGDPVTPAALREPVPQRTGVNVVGYFRAEFGIGEAGRSLATALRTAGVPHALLDFSSGSLNRNADTSIDRFDTAPPYGISILCANPDQFAYFDHHATATAFGGGRYRIGAWWFELPDLPEAWLGGFARVDEVWVGSRFVEAAVARVSTVPVTYMPPIVEPRATAPVSRAEFGLADDDLAFLLVFDFNSVVERKNPAGAVAAFRRAFPPGRARLLIKTINAPLHPEAFARLRDDIGDDARIRLIDEYYDRDRIARLMRACDAYVSLHRAEGFGLTIAEAMLYGKPVVVTGWSGNLDFTTQENSFLVDARLVRIDRAYGPYYAGGLWAEPDLDAAAAAMRVIAEQPHEAARRAERGRLDVRLLFSRGRVGSLMRARIDALAAMGKGRT